MANSKILNRSLADDAVKVDNIEDLAITNAKIANTTIANAKLVNSSITVNGQPIALGASGTIDTGEGDLPTISTSSLIAEPTTDTTLTINGTNYVSIPKVELVKTTGAITTAPTVTFDSATQLQFTTGSGLAAGTYYVRVINPDGGTVTTSSAILTISAAPA